MGYEPLATAVSEADGLGLITAGSYPTQKEMIKDVELVRTRTNKPFGVNLAIGIRKSMDEYVECVIESGVNIMFTSGYSPEKYRSIKKVMEMRMELLHALEEAENDELIKCIILTGQGKAFSAGGDLSALKGLKPLEGRKRLQKSQPLLMKMLEIEKPIIAAVNGVAVGAGFSLTLLCDLIIAFNQAFFVHSFVKVGLIPDFAGIHLMLIGPRRANELMFLGERISALEAHQLGIVNRVVSPDTLLQETIEIAERLVKKSSISIGMTKKIICIQI